MSYNLNKMPSYSGLHYIMSKFIQPKQRTSLELENKLEQVDINHLVDDEFDINNSILADEPMEIQQQQEFWDEKMAEEYSTLAKMEQDFENDI